MRWKFGHGYEDMMYITLEFGKITMYRDRTNLMYRERTRSMDYRAK